MPYKDKAKQKEYYEKNKERLLAYHKKYREDHKDAVKKKVSECYDKNKEKYNKRKREYANSPAEYDIFIDKISPYEECQRDPENQELIQVRCKYCGRWFNPTNDQLRHRLTALNCEITGRTHGESNLYCSEACKKSCPTYGQILYPKDFKQNTSREVQPELRKMVLARDNWTCQKCGKSKDEIPELILHCHHIFPLNEDPIRSADIDNCETLCKECHEWKHKNIPGCSYPELKC